MTCRPGHTSSGDKRTGRSAGTVNCFKTPFQSDTAGNPKMPMKKHSGMPACMWLSLCRDSAPWGRRVVWTSFCLSCSRNGLHFSIILAIFLAGLGIGSSIGPFSRDKAANHELPSADANCLLQVPQHGRFIITRSIPYWQINVVDMPQISDHGTCSGGSSLVRLCGSACGCTVGGQLSSGIGLRASQNKDSGRMVGGVYAANTIGAIIGSLAFSMILIPSSARNGHRGFLSALRRYPHLCLCAFYCTQANNKQKGAKPFPQPVAGSRKPAVILLSLILIVLLMYSIAPVPWIAVAFGRFSSYG